MDSKSEIDQVAALSQSKGKGANLVPSKEHEGIFFVKGRIDETLARELASEEQANFLHCGKRPQRGQRIETVVHVPRTGDVCSSLDRTEQDFDDDDSSSCLKVRLSGIATSVGDLPSFSDWTSGDNFARRLPHCPQCHLRPLKPYEEIQFRFPTSCSNGLCYTNRAAVTNTNDPATYMAAMMKWSLLIHGTLHNQEVVSYAFLHPESDNNNIMLQGHEEESRTATPFRSGHTYKLVLRAQDSLPSFYWKVTSIWDVTHSENFEELPEEFRAFAHRKQLSTDGNATTRNLNNETDMQDKDNELAQFLEDHHGKMDSSFDGI